MDLELRIGQGSTPRNLTNNRLSEVATFEVRLNRVNQILKFIKNGAEFFALFAKT